jgi:hypothetical protein
MSQGFLIPALGMGDPPSALKCSNGFAVRPNSGRILVYLEQLRSPKFHSAEFERAKATPPEVPGGVSSLNHS